MRSLNMGLTLQEIDQLCSVCQSDVNSMFDWKEFAKMLQNRQADFKILDRASIHLARINDHIYNYLIAPKDAFRQFDVDHNGTLSFQ
jgi:Ca2+-binding EF-hand superfamily protein